MNIDLILISHRLTLDSHFEKTANLFCNVAGANKTNTISKYILGSWYEGYLYCLLLGIKIKNRIPRKGKPLDKAPKWSDRQLNQYKYAISILLTKNDVVNELNLISREAIKNNFERIGNTLDQIKKICDEYSNGGLEYLADLYEKDDNIFANYKSLKEIYQNAKP